MDTSNWRPSEGETSVAGGSSVEPGDWRDQLQAASRDRIVNKIMDTLKRHLPFSGDEGLQELNKIAVRFENKIHTAAVSQSDYLRKISLKMLTMETRSQNPMPDAVHPNPVTNGVNPPYPDVASPITVRPLRNKKTWTRVQDEKLVDVLMELHASGKYKYDAEYGFKPGYFQAVQNLLDISLPNSGLKAEPHIKSRVKKLKSNFCIVHEMLVDTDTSGFGWDPIKCCVIADDQAWDDYLQTHKSASHFRDKSFPFYDKLFIIFGKDRATGSRVVDVEDEEEEEDEIVGETQESTPFDLTETDIDMGVQLTREGMEGTSSKRKRGKGLSLDSTAQSSNPNGGDWQEEVYQKIKAMKDLYLLDLNDMHQKIVSKLQKHESLPQQLMNEQIEKLRIFKNMMERFMQFLQIPKHGILANYKDKLGTYEKQILNVINSNRRKPAPTQQQGQALPPTHMQQSQQTHSQLTQVQSHENQMNLQGSMGSMQQNNMGNMQQNNVPSLSGGSNAQTNMMNSLQQPSTNLDPGQNSSMNSLQQVSGGSLQQNAVSGPQQVNINPMSLQPNPNMLQDQHIKQQEQLHQNQQLKQFQHRQMQHQFLQKQQLLQQQQQQQFQQQTKQQQGNQLSQLHQINDGGDIKLSQQMGVKSAAFQQHQAAAAQRSAYHQQLKSGAPFSPQLLSAASPQMSQHASPQIDQSSMFKSANSPFAVPSPSTPSASPLPGDFERINGVSSLSNVGHQQQPSGAVVPTQSHTIGTPGISASPLLAEFTSPDGNHGVVPSIGSGKSTAAEQPLERLLKAVKSISSTALSASVGDIGSVVSMIDRIAGSAPGNGSRAAVGEDLVAMTKCRIQSRNFVTQDATNGVRKMKRFTSAMPLNVVSSAGSVNDSFKQLNVAETSELDSTASSVTKRPRVETNHALLEEIKEINRGLIDTVVDVSEEDVDPAAASEGGDGTVVKCSFSAVALGPNLKSQYASAQMSPIQPLRLLVPANYPNCSPILLDKFPAEVSKEFEDLSIKTKSRFSISLRSLSQPMSLKEIAKTWDVCARAVISEYAQQSGGGTFSSKYGTWEHCLSAA